MVEVSVPISRRSLNEIEDAIPNHNHYRCCTRHHISASVRCVASAASRAFRNRNHGTEWRARRSHMDFPRRARIGMGMRAIQHQKTLNPSSRLERSEQSAHHKALAEFGCTPCL